MKPIYSMTGFASLRGSVGDGPGFTLAMKSVNHRFLDLHMRFPSYCDGLEVQMRRALKDLLRRGHVEVTLQVDRRTTAQVQLNTELLSDYVDAFRKAAELYALADQPDLNGMLRIPGMMSVETSLSAEANSDLDAAVWAIVPEVVAKLNEGRAAEGAALAAGLRAST